MSAGSQVQEAEIVNCYKPKSDWTYMTFEECMQKMGAKITRFGKK